ncbi:hypothetical protein KBD34_03690 [Patescibacteria group bacterium]|nr:hypothetical protein [Patescibacteria group bacterium]
MNAPATDPRTKTTDHDPHTSQIVFDEKGVESPLDLPMLVPEQGGWRQPGHIIPAGYVVVSAQRREALLTQSLRRTAREAKLQDDLAKANTDLADARREYTELKAASKRAFRLTFDSSSCMRDPINVGEWAYMRDERFSLLVRTYTPNGNQLLTPCTLPSEHGASIGIGDMGDDGYVVVIRRGDRVRPRIKDAEVGYYVLVMSLDIEFTEEFYTAAEFEAMLMSSDGFQTAPVAPGQRIKLRGYQGDDPKLLRELFERVIRDNYANSFRLKTEAAQRQLESSDPVAGALPAGPQQPSAAAPARSEVDVKDVKTTPMTVAKPAAGPAGPSLPPPVPEVARQSVRPDARPSRDDAGSTGPKDDTVGVDKGLEGSGKADPKADGASRPTPTGNGGINEEPVALEDLAALTTQGARPPAPNAPSA